MAAEKSQNIERITGISGAARAWMISGLRRKYSSIVVISRDRGVSEALAADLRFFCGDSAIKLFSAWDTLALEHVSPQTHISAQRIAALHHLATSTEFVLTASVDAVLHRTLPLPLLQTLAFELRVGETIRRPELLKLFERGGFRRVSIVEEIGELAVRGAVLDFFDARSDYPLRAEFNGDTLVSLKQFKPGDQRTIGSITSVKILPVAERITFTNGLISQDEQRSALERLKHRAQDLDLSTREQARALELIQSGADFPGLELFQPFLLPQMASFFDYLPENCLIIIDDQHAIDNSLDSSWEIINERVERLKTEDLIFPAAEKLFVTPDEFQSQLQRFRQVHVDSLSLKDYDEQLAATTNIRSSSNVELATRLRTLVGSGKALEPLKHYVSQLRSAGYDLAFSAGSQSRAERLQQLLLDLGLDVPISSSTAQAWLDSTKRPHLTILEGLLSAGFQLPELKLAFVSEHEIFSERSYRKGQSATTNIKRLLGAIAQLKEGDYIVHSDFGIGLYGGLKHKRVNDAETDMLMIDYADTRLFLPVQHIGKIQKFSAAEGKAPTLDKLSSQRWNKTKRKVRESVATLAGDLVRLYAARSAARGWRFEPYGAEDDRFADGFAYDETPDQLRAIEETLEDMASDKPMDRLVCGDVGFGKTEVAIRAAFKCIQHGRQVAVLVPTTLLAEQHFESFSSRFIGYPVKLAAVSRFFKPFQNKETLARLAQGEIDIIIGTHRLLSRDVRFNDLGLVIVDEEHRFGVKQKERLKALKKQVDILTLTATPIPRTLHMALLGIRDVSVINTPPHDRRLIRTYVASFEDTLIRDAIIREKQRSGQVFFVHNKVEDIEIVTSRLRELVPEASFDFAHGQMSEVQLEKIMHRFLKGDTDVLVSTTIVESGLDIPNANTVIVDRADTFGLAQLYQIRGRVGRSSRQAYSYFLIPKSGKLTDEAQKRLKVLQSLDDLGVGFNLAVRDLEIRGAGNLLGKEQSGNVLMVGYELYCRILKEAILNLKGEDLELDEIIDPEVRLPIDAFIPDYYIPDVSERLVLYQRMASLQSSAETDQLAEEIADRFGKAGREVSNLLEIMRLRSLLRHFGVERADITAMRIVLAFSARAPIDTQKILRLIRSDSARYRFSKNHALSITIEPELLEQPEGIYPMLEKLLIDIGTPIDATTGTT